MLPENIHDSGGGNTQPWDIEFRALSAGYGTHTVLNDISAILPGGKITVILGGSGCGKSTLLRHIIGLTRPLAGTLLLGGADIFSLGKTGFRRLRRRMGVLFQDGALLGSLSVVQNVALPLSEHLPTSIPTSFQAACASARDWHALLWPNRAFFCATSPHPGWTL